MVRYDRNKYNKELLGSVILPKAMNQDSIVLVFAEGKAAEEAKAAGADIVGGGELIQQIQEGLIEFNKCISTPAMLPQVTKIARVLGPRGLMPTVKKGNVTNDLAPAIMQFKGMFDYKSDHTGMVRLGIAKLGFNDQEIQDNIQTVLSSIYEIGAPSVKKGFLQQVCISTNQLPGLLVDDIIANTVSKYKLLHSQTE
ncbi:ribosomal protein L1 [Neoconidiobolus thromboides FSU 785]|nr:ribosomal protein L1 [Neoconidiobolus thromboides FSU 785]